MVPFPKKRVVLDPKLTTRLSFYRDVCAIVTNRKSNAKIRIPSQQTKWYNISEHTLKTRIGELDDSSIEHSARQNEL